MLTDLESRSRGGANLVGNPELYQLPAIHLDQQDCGLIRWVLLERTTIERLGGQPMVEALLPALNGSRYVTTSLGGGHQWVSLQEYLAARADRIVSFANQFWPEEHQAAAGETPPDLEREWSAVSLPPIRSQMNGLRPRVAFSPCGRYIAFASTHDATVRVWEVAAKREVMLLTGEHEFCDYFGGSDGDCEDGVWDQFDDGFAQIAFTSDGKHLVIFDATGLHAYAFPSGKLARFFAIKAQYQNDSRFLFDRDGNTIIAMIFHDPNSLEIAVCDLATGAIQKRWTIPGVGNGLSSDMPCCPEPIYAGFGPNKTLILIGPNYQRGGGGMLHRVSLESGEVVEAVCLTDIDQSLAEGRISAAFCPDGSYAVCAVDENVCAIRLTDLTVTWRFGRSHTLPLRAAFMNGREYCYNESENFIGFQNVISGSYPDVSQVMGDILDVKCSLSGLTCLITDDECEVIDLELHTVASLRFADAKYPDTRSDWVHPDLTAHIA